MNIGSGRTESFGVVENLRQSEVDVLKSLMQWDYTKKRASSFEIGTEINLAQSTVVKALRHLKGRNIVLKSRSGHWFIPKEVKENISSSINP